MKATIDGQTYDTEQAECVASDCGRDNDINLYQTAQGAFFLEKIECLLDGKPLPPGKQAWDIDSRLGPIRSKRAQRERNRRMSYRHHIWPVSARQAMIWCIKTQIPECFRGYFLESI